MPRSLISIIATSDQNVDPGYDIYFTDTSSNTVTLTLPVITADGQHFYFRNINTTGPDDTTINAGGSDTINEAGSSYVLFTGTFNHFVALGTNWYIIG